MTVGENISRIRQERNLTQRQLGEMVGASEAYIRAYEIGRRNPKPSSIEKIADALSVNPEVLANSDFDSIKSIHRFFRYSSNMMDISLNTRIKIEMIWLESSLEHCL